MGIKTVDQRVQECLQLRSKLKELGIDKHNDLREYFEHMNAFVRDGTGYSANQTLPTLERKLEYTFSTQSHVESTAVLRYFRKQ